MLKREIVLTDRKSIKFLAAFLCILMCIVSLFVFSGCTGKKVDYSNMASENYVPSNVEVFTDELGEVAIKLNEDRDLKVLQLTDIHIGNGPFTVKKDKKAISAICSLIEHVVPDLIVLSGDMVFPVSVITGSNDNLAALKALVSLIEAYKTPWTVCFGNHDAESMAKFSKSEICSYLESEGLKYCLFSRGPSELDGMGNHLINVYNFDNSFNSTIFFFDNGMYLGETQLSGYQEITESQTNWYREKVESFSAHYGETIDSYVYYHVPGKEYELGWEDYKNGGEDSTYFFGQAGEKNERISCPSELGTFFPTVVELGSTKAIFCGHDHLNDFSIEYMGVRLTYGKSIDYTAYVFQGIANKTEQRGATVLTIKTSTSQSEEKFLISSIKLEDIV